MKTVKWATAHFTTYMDGRGKEKKKRGGKEGGARGSGKVLLRYEFVEDPKLKKFRRKI